VTLLLAVFALVATLAAAFCAFADGALLAVDDEAPAPTPEVASLVERRERAHRALAFGRILSQLLAGAAAVAALKASAVPPVQLAPLVVIAGILIVVLAESGARAAGDIEAEQGVVRAYTGIIAVENLLGPVVALGAAADRMLDALLPAPAESDEGRETSVEQFREVVAAEAGVSTDDERLLRGVFSLGDTTVQDIMVPRVDVVGIDHSCDWDAVIARIRAARHARYVVYERTVDNVVGILHAKDLLASVLAGEEMSAGWRSVVRPAQFIPATKPVDDQLREFRATRRHMAVVVDEFGGTSGVVTLEDALEVIVGDIRDEHDVEEPEVRRDATGGFYVSARLTIDDLNELTGADFSRDDVHTVGGLIYAVIGGVPRQGDVLDIGAHRLIVERVVRRRIERVRLERVPSAALGQAGRDR
jgi:putative hemolysin